VFVLGTQGMTCIRAVIIVVIRINTVTFNDFYHQKMFFGKSFCSGKAMKGKSECKTCYKTKGKLNVQREN